MSVSETLSAIGSILVFYNDEDTNYRLFQTTLCESWDHVITSRFCYQMFIKHFLYSLLPLSDFWNENILSIETRTRQQKADKLLTILNKQPLHATFWNVEISTLHKSKHFSQFRHTYPDLYYCQLITHLFNISNVNIHLNIDKNPLSLNKNDNNNNGFFAFGNNFNHNTHNIFSSDNSNTYSSSMSDKNTIDRLDVLFESTHQSPYFCDEKDFIFNYKLFGALDPDWLLLFSNRSDKGCANKPQIKMNNIRTPKKLNNQQNIEKKTTPKPNSFVFVCNNNNNNTNHSNDNANWGFGANSNTKNGQKKVDVGWGNDINSSCIGNNEGFTFGGGSLSFGKDQDTENNDENENNCHDSTLSKSMHMKTNDKSIENSFEKHEKSAIKHDRGTRSNRNNSDASRKSGTKLNHMVDKDENNGDLGCNSWQRLYFSRNVIEEFVNLGKNKIEEKDSIQLQESSTDDSYFPKQFNLKNDEFESKDSKDSKTKQFWNDTLKQCCDLKCIDWKGKIRFCLSSCLSENIIAAEKETEKEKEKKQEMEHYYQQIEEKNAKRLKDTLYEAYRETLDQKEAKYDKEMQENIDKKFDQLWVHLSRFFMIPKFGMKLKSNKCRVRAKYWYILNGNYYIKYSYAPDSLNSESFTRFGYHRGWKREVNEENIGIIYLIGVMSDQCNLNPFWHANDTICEQIIVLKCIIYNNSCVVCQDSASDIKVYQQVPNSLKQETKKDEKVWHDEFKVDGDFWGNNGSTSSTNFNGNSKEFSQMMHNFNHGKWEQEQEFDAWEDS